MRRVFVNEYGEIRVGWVILFMFLVAFLVVSGARWADAQIYKTFQADCLTGYHGLVEGDAGGEQFVEVETGHTLWLPTDVCTFVEVPDRFW